MQDFTYRQNELYAENLPLKKIAQTYGTPTYVYSRAALSRHYRAYAQALTRNRVAGGVQQDLICYAVKANSNLAVLQILAQLGAGFDIVSAGELQRVLSAGGDPGKVVFSGVGKTAAEMACALDADVYCFNVESQAELEILAGVAADKGVKARVSLRVNPDVDAKTHPYISTGLKENKFGVDIVDAPTVYQYAATQPSLVVKGIDCHIGSQLTDMAPFLDALDRVLGLIDQLACTGINIEHLDLGGGLGVVYRDEKPPEIGDFIAAIAARLADRALRLIFEPGRSIAAQAGVLLTRVIYLKPTRHKNFAIIDAAMNDNIRPALYGAWQDILPLCPRQSQPQVWDLAGPVCETADILAKQRALALQPGDYLAMMAGGAYGFSMSSNYNSRVRAAEVMVDGDAMHLVRARESVDDLMRGEALLPCESALCGDPPHRTCSQQT